jgi:DNA repair exonuclease SbcCD nuclease subunit
MTTILAIGDIHMHPGDRREIKLAALDQALNVAAALGPGAILYLGDIFHAKSSIEDRNAIAERIQRSAMIAPTGILPGNHDAEGDLEIFGKLAGACPISVFSHPGCYRIRLATGQSATLFALPYPHRHGLVMAGCPHPELIDAAADHLDAIFMKAAIDLEDARAKGDITLMIGHANISGAIASNGQPQVGMEISVMPRHLDRLGHVPKLFGHIHKPQELHGATYAGSISRGDFGEIEDKRFLVVTFERSADITEGDYASEWLYDIDSVGLKVPPMGHVEGRLTREGFTWQLIAGPGGEPQEAPASFDGWHLRVRYSFQASERAVLDHSLAKAPFTAAAILQMDPIATPDRQLRAPEVAAAKTLSDKLTAWCALAGTVASDCVLQKLAKLETIADPQVHVEAARDHATDIAAGDVEQKATVAA